MHHPAPPTPSARAASFAVVVPTLLAMLAGGCGWRAAPIGLPDRSPAPALPAPAAAEPERWPVAAPSNADDTVRFVIQSRAEMTARADSLFQADTLETRTELRVLPRGAAIDVTVESYVIRPRNAAPRTLPLPVRAVGRFGETGGVTFEGGSAGACGTIAAAAIESTRDLWVKWPSALRVGDVWRDSSRVGICRDAIPLMLSVAREFRVTGMTGDSLTREFSIERQSRISLRGTGAIRGSQVDVAGEGTGHATLLLAATTGWIASGEATSSLRLRAADARRTQLVAQEVRVTFHRAIPRGVPREPPR